MCHADGRKTNRGLNTKSRLRYMGQILAVEKFFIASVWAKLFFRFYHTVVRIIVLRFMQKLVIMQNRNLTIHTPFSISVLGGLLLRCRNWLCPLISSGSSEAATATCRVRPAGSIQNNNLCE